MGHEMEKTEEQNEDEQVSYEQNGSDLVEKQEPTQISIQEKQIDTATDESTDVDSDSTPVTCDDYSELLELTKVDELIDHDAGKLQLWAYEHGYNHEMKKVDWHKERTLMTLCKNTFSINLGGQSNAKCSLATSGGYKGFSFLNKATDEIFTFYIDGDDITGTVANKLEPKPEPEPIEKPKAIEEEVDDFDYSVFEDLDDDETWSVEPPTDDEYVPNGLDNEKQILDRVIETDSRQFFRDKKFNASWMRKYLIEKCGFDFIVLPNDSKVRFLNNGVYITDHTKVINKSIAKLIGSSYTPTHTSNTLGLIKDVDTIGEVASTEFPALHPQWINCGNGMLHIKKQLLVPHKQFYKQYPQQRSIIQLPVDYNEDATCEAFDEFLDEKLPSDLDKEFIYEAFGYSMLQHCGLEKFFILKGESDTGKSTVLNVLKEMLGSRNVSATSLTEIDRNSGRFGLSKLYGKLANISHESSQYRLDGSGALKLVVDGNEQNIEEKYAQSWKQKLFATVWGATNVPVTSKDDSSGFWNRLIIVPFDVTHEKVDPNKEHELTQRHVLNGVFLRSFRALRKLLKRGHFIVTPSMEHAKTINRAGDDEIQLFAAQYLSIKTKVQYENKIELARVPRTELYAVYEKLCLDDDTKAKPRKDFYDTIERWSGSATYEGRIWGTDLNTKFIAGTVFNDDGYDLVSKLNMKVTSHKE